MALVAAMKNFHSRNCNYLFYRQLKIDIVIVKPWVRVTDLRWTPHSVIVTIGDNRDYIGVLLDSYYTTVIPLLQGGDFT